MGNQQNTLANRKRDNDLQNIIQKIKGWSSHRNTHSKDNHLW